MSDPIKFYYACISPWSYLAVDALKTLAEKHGRDIAYKPTHVGKQWQETGTGRPLGDRPAVLQAYRLVELPRWAAWRDVPVNTVPKHFPVPFLLSSSVIIAARQAGADMYEITRALMRGC
ncbi:MAG: 2-hydroxychromene-2-carboxylate isomerase, partial [Alphaproteobacteria bacterium]|nr:2-hydroxychromene-2-carboxylate isomerase [Alphaproteobacteria bacterium]